jgi:hypothetical protein
MRGRLRAVRILHTAGGADEEGHRFLARFLLPADSRLSRVLKAFWACFATRPSSASDEFMSSIDALQNSLTAYSKSTI